MTAAERKREIRKELKLAVQQLPKAYCQEADSAIARHILALPEYEAAKTIFCFVGRNTEINTIPILQDAWKQGKQVGVPLCIKKGIMEVRHIACMEDLEAGQFGICEPKPQMPFMEPESMDLVIVPCLSCGSDGTRLGYGGGYYDQYLAKVKCPKCVICRKRLMREDIPREVHDVSIEMVICEYGKI